MMRNFAQRGGQVGTLLDCRLLGDEHATASVAADIGFATSDVPPTVDFAHPTPDAIAFAEVARLPADFDRLAREKYERMFPIRAC